MKVLIRADASVTMGSGHIMRCLTLADELRSQGASVRFVSRHLPGEMSSLVGSRGYESTMLPAPQGAYVPTPTDVEHAKWLGVSWEQDLRETREAFGNDSFDWLVVDHYGLERRWERQMRTRTKRILVIDDLADREHDCDLLLDQTFGRKALSYASLVPSSCEMLLGSEYALLRPEFLSLRTKALEKRANFGQIQHILVAMGGADPDNVTQKALRGLAKVNWEIKPSIQVVLGSQAPHWEAVKTQAANTDLEITVSRAVSNMAELMLEADLAVGASGTSSWERCCLGLPSLVTVTADNQNDISLHLENEGAILGLGRHESLPADRIAEKVDELRDTPGLYHKMVDAMKDVCDGTGAQLVARRMQG